MLFGDNELAWNVLMFLSQFRQSGYTKINACQISFTHILPAVLTDNQCQKLSLASVFYCLWGRLRQCASHLQPDSRSVPKSPAHVLFKDVIYENSIIWTSEGSEGKWEQDGLVLSRRKCAMMKARETENQVLVRYPRRCSWSRLHLGSGCWARICFLISGSIADWLQFCKKKSWIELLTIRIVPKQLWQK